MILSKVQRDYIKNKKKLDAARKRVEKLQQPPGGRLGAKIVKRDPDLLLILDSGTKLYSQDDRIYGVVPEGTSYKTTKGAVMLLTPDGKVSERTLNRISGCFDGVVALDSRVGVEIYFHMPKNFVKETGVVYSEPTEQDVEKAKTKFIKGMYCVKFSFKGDREIELEPSGFEDVRQLFSRRISEELVDAMVLFANREST